MSPEHFEPFYVNQVKLVHVRPFFEFHSSILFLGHFCVFAEPDGLEHQNRQSADRVTSLSARFSLCGWQDIN